VTISILHNKNVCPGTLTDTVHRLISMISNKNVTVKQGPSACIDKNHTIYLPPLPKDATEKDFIRYFHLGTHEQAHIYGGSDFERASTDPLLFKIENALEDIRCEELQEKEYQGLKPYRVRFYQDALEAHLNAEFMNADPSNIHNFILAISKLIIITVRMKQLNAMHLKVSVSDALINAYCKHVRDLETRIINMTSTDEMFELASLIYSRLKDIIREELKKKQTTQQKQSPKQENKDDDQDSQDEEDTQTGDSSEESETDPEESAGDQSDDSGDAEAPEEGEDSSEEESEGSDSGDNGDPKGDDSAADGDSSEGNPEDEEDNALTGDSDNENSGSNDAPDSGSDTDNDDSTDNDTDDSADPVHEGSVDSDDEDKEASDSSTDPDVSEDDESRTDETDGSGQSGSSELEIDISKIIDDLKDSDAPIDVMTKIINDINQDVKTRALPYMVNPNLVDHIYPGRETDDKTGIQIKEAGLSMLGPKGSQLTKIFISQTKPLTRYNQLRGQFDVRAFASDVNDSRDDLFTNQTGAKLDKAAITFLMDNSSSMLGIIYHTYALLSGVLYHLSKACIPTEAIGYTIGDNKSDVWRDVPAQLSIIKEFKESYSGKVLRRCIPPSYLGLTNDLDGMRFAVPRLWARPEKKKVIIVMCDGKPYLGNATLTDKMRQAYIEYIDICRKAGIIVFGIGIGVDLTEFFGTDFVNVTDSNVGEVLLTKLTEILNRRRA
jgi:hypothetical protein